MTKSLVQKDDDVSNHDVEENFKSPSQNTQIMPLMYVNPTGEPINLDSQNLNPHVSKSQPNKNPNHHTPAKAATSESSYGNKTPVGFHGQSTIETQQIHYESPTKKQPSRSPIQDSPKKPPIPPNTQVSPIHLHNKFGPLLRPNKLKSSSTSTLGSSSCSGPLFPPGFEDSIPIQTKIEKEKSVKEKWRKRIK